MTKAISVVIIVLLLVGGWRAWVYYDQFTHERDLQQKAEASIAIVPEQLSGMPRELELPYKAAVKQGPTAVKNWLRRNHQLLSDPRLAWIELDYMLSIVHDNPVEAKKLFEDVKERIQTNSPVYFRVQKLEKTYE